MPDHDLCIANQWSAASGEPFSSTDPATGEVVWQGRAASEADVSRAASAGREAFENWSSLSVEDRADRLRRFAEQLKSNRDRLAQTISREIGKPLWESLSEVDAMVAKIEIAIDAFHHRRAETRLDIAGSIGLTRYKPHGVLAVLGPFNMPGHLPNGHIVPALLAGNCIIFKPSEYAPAVGELTAELWQAASLPAGVLNLVQGTRDTGAAVLSQRDIDGILFTGSLAAGRAIARALCDHVGKIVALEMGGNNPLIVWDVGDLDAAALVTIQSAYITSGQRCSCARRLIVPGGPSGDRFIERLVAGIGKIRVAPWTMTPEPFMGPVISREAAARLRSAHAAFVSRGATALTSSSPSPGTPLAPSPGTPGEGRGEGMRGEGLGTSHQSAFLPPTLLDVTSVKSRPDEELFGPILQLVRVPDFDSAINEANNTQYGLSAGLLSDDPSLWDHFYRRIRAGVLSWNRPTTNASSRLPFGGIGLSGNHRPSGSFAADYCSYPVAIIQQPTLRGPGKLPPGLG